MFKQLHQPLDWVCATCDRFCLRNAWRSCFGVVFSTYFMHQRIVVNKTLKPKFKNHINMLLQNRRNARIRKNCDESPPSTDLIQRHCSRLGVFPDICPLGGDVDHRGLGLARAHRHSLRPGRRGGCGCACTASRIDNRLLTSLFRTGMEHIVACGGGAVVRFRLNTKTCINRQQT